MKKIIKKIITSLFMSVVVLCMISCQTQSIKEYAPLSLIVKDENFNEAYAVVSDDVVLIIDYNKLKEERFYINIMNSMAKPTDVLPEVVPDWTMMIKSEDSTLKIDNMGALYAEYNNKYYQIMCSFEDKNALSSYILYDKAPVTDILEITRIYTGKIKVHNAIDLSGNSYNMQIKNLKTGEDKSAINKEEILTLLFKNLSGRDSIYDYTNCMMDYSIEISYPIYNGKSNEIELNKYEFKIHFECGAMTIIKNNNLIGTVVLSKEEIDELSTYISYNEGEKYKLSITDNFNLLITPLKEYYEPGEIIEFKTKSFSGPKVSAKLDGVLLQPKHNEVFGYEQYEFVMPKHDIKLILLYNDLIASPCENNNHNWDNGQIVQVPGGGKDMLYNCLTCGATKTERVEDFETYSLTFVGETQYLKEDISGQYGPTSYITILTQIIYDANIELYANGVKVPLDISDNRLDVWCFNFVMPSEDVIIEIRVVGGI